MQITRQIQLPQLRAPQLPRGFSLSRKSQTGAVVGLEIEAGSIAAAHALGDMTTKSAAPTRALQTRRSRDSPSTDRLEVRQVRQPPGRTSRPLSDGDA